MIPRCDFCHCSGGDHMFGCLLRKDAPAPQSAPKPNPKCRWCMGSGWYPGENERYVRVDHRCSCPEEAIAPLPQSAPDVVTSEEARAIVRELLPMRMPQDQRLLRFIDQAEQALLMAPTLVEAERRAREECVATMTENARLRAACEAAYAEGIWLPTEVSEMLREALGK